MIDRVEKEVDMMERHLEVLAHVRENQPIGIVKLASRTGFPNHKVRYSLRVLEEEGIIEPTEQGAVTTDRTEGFISEFNERIGGIADMLASMKEAGEPVEREQ